MYFLNQPKYASIDDDDDDDDLVSKNFIAIINKLFDDSDLY